MWRTQNYLKKTEKIIFGSIKWRVRQPNLGGPLSSGIDLVRHCSRPGRGLLCRSGLWRRRRCLRLLLRHRRRSAAALRGRVGQTRACRLLISSPRCGRLFDRRYRRTLCNHRRSAPSGRFRRHRCRCRCRWPFCLPDGICWSFPGLAHPGCWSSRTASGRSSPPTAGR
jgi:hypothetical protein